MFLHLKTFLYLGTLLAVGFGLWRAVLAPEERRWFDWRFTAPIWLAAIGLFAPRSGRQLGYWG